MEDVLERMRDEQGPLLGNIRFDDPAFEDIFSMRTNGDVVYAGTPMGKVCRNISGNICEDVVRRVHARYLPSSVEVVDAVVGTRCDGKKRCKNTTSYDFGARTGSDTKRVEVKSSKLYFDGKQRCNCWCASFLHVKFHKFDELLLGLITPDALCVFKYDVKRRPFASTQGKRVTGDGIQVTSHKDDTIEEAVTTIIKKLCLCGCEFLYRIEW